MDLFSLGFLILIVLMSGGIAVLADDLGRRLGKKRLHVKGLRPKRVAQIGTALAGIMVSLITIIVVASASDGVRQWIAQGRRAIGERDRAIRERDKFRSEVNAAAQELQDARQRNSDLRAKNDGLSKQTSQQQHVVERQKGAIADNERQIAGLRPQVISLRKRAQQATLEAQSKQREIDRNKQEIARRQSQLAKVSQRIKTITRQLSSVQTNLDQAERLKQSAVAQHNEAVGENNKLNAQKLELQREINELEGQIAKLEHDRNEAIQASQEARTELEVAQKDLAQNRRELESVSDALNNAKLQALQLKFINDQSRNAPPMYLKGDEVARLPIEPGLSFAKASAALQTLLRSSRMAAQRLGAKQNGQYAEAGIFPHTDRLTGDTIPPEKIEREIISKIAGSKEPMVLVAVSSINSFQGEPVSLEVLWMPNPIVYKENEIVAETRLDARKDPAVLIDGISALGEMVRERAKKDNMLPRATDDLKNSLGQDQVWKLLNEVKKSGGFVRLRAIAQGDIRAGDPLRVKIQVR